MATDTTLMKKSLLTKLFDFTHCAWTLGKTPAQRAELLWRLTKNVRVAMGMAGFEPQKVLRLGTRYGELYIRDNFGDITNLPDLLARDIYRFHPVTADGAVFDVGANIGLFAFLASKLAPRAEIHCFEPLPANVAMVQRNCPQAIVNQAAVGKSRGTMTLSVDADEVMASSIPNPRSRKDVQFDVVTLDDYVREKAIERIAFLKMDCEGMELEAFAGGQQALARTLRIALETHGPDRHQSVLDHLRAAGFRITHEEFDGTTGMVHARRE
jgi:FkbM family methyltransferase